MNTQVDLAIIGGSGLYKIFSESHKINIPTPYGKTSAKISIGKLHDKLVAFLPRHGEKHTIPPHLIPYRANLWALKKLGVKRIFAPCAVGSLDENIEPGEIVICDQFVNFTSGRIDSFFQGQKSKHNFSKYKVAHISAANIYCPEVSLVVGQTADEIGLKCHKTGTVVVINGPRFSSKAESIFYQRSGWNVINMTQYPENVLASELGMCYTNISLVTDYDSGVVGSKRTKPVEALDVMKVLKLTNEQALQLISQSINNLPIKLSCNCMRSLDNAGVS